MKYVLLKLTDEQADKFLGKPTSLSKVLGVWETAGPCICSKIFQNQRENWTYDPVAGRFICVECGGAHSSVTTLSERLRWAFRGTNQVLRYRPRKKKR